MEQNQEWVRRWMQLSAQVLNENREYLIELDRQIGDGDHGENMDRGFTAVARSERLTEPGTTAELLKHIAKTLLSTVGGAAGPLYGTAFLRAARSLGDRLGDQMGDLAEDRLLTAQDVADFLQVATDGVQARGKAEAGDKTMVDALLPAIGAARQVADAGGTAAQAWQAAAEAGQEGAEATELLRARKGRASYLGERSVGHLDPGAVSAALVLQAAATAANETLVGVEEAP